MVQNTLVWGNSAHPQRPCLVGQVAIRPGS
jgi:hypothetical protein